ncbi:Ig-like domain-containing protein [Thalassotalea sp. ND16A]|uniref:Ig-like domain-containing protein n=1 Tax=Thalassotalea sp. ND16A TaxID=1535422 RepID=UPI00051A475D|nr:Ig-like domain-containing protein [Thalassotalea sp. ND16A]KGJ98467.1 hypothetical protein ND16A_0656 [Thalassotalea sp. ND16A]
MEQLTQIKLTISKLIYIASIFILAGCGGSGSDDKEPTQQTANQPPSINSPALTTATEDIEYQYQLVATDPETAASALIYSLNSAPAGMVISSAGMITWTPLEGVLTSGEVIVNVADGTSTGALSVTQSFNIDVTPVNDQPVIVSTAVTVATEDIEYQYQLVANDPDSAASAFIYSLNSAPAGMGISSAGMITWTPLEGVLTSGEVIVNVADGTSAGALSVTQSFNIDVTPVNDQPVIVSTAVTVATEDIEYQYQLAVNDPDTAASLLVYSFDSAAAEMSISTTGLITWTPLEGVLTSGAVIVKVAEGNSAGALSVTQTFTIDVTPVNDQPVIVSIAPTQIDNETTLSYPLEVVDPDDENNGTDLSFELVTAPSGMSISSTGEILWTPMLEQSSLLDINVTIIDGGEDNTTVFSHAFQLDVLVYQIFSGQIVNYFTGDAVPNATVQFSNGIENVASAIADESGFFTVPIVDRNVTANMLASVDVNNYAQAATVLSNQTSDQVQFIAMLPVHASIFFDSSEAQELMVDEQSLLSLSANSLAREDGEAIEGLVNAQITIIDPSSDINIMPGDMVTMENNQRLPIESFGAMNVVFKDESGQVLNLITGQSAEIRIPLAQNSISPPNLIPLYYFDNATNTWVEEGEASLTTIGVDSFYQGNVNHFTTWNADKVYETIFINGCVEDQDGNVLSDVSVSSQGRDYNGTSNTRTDSLGDYSLPVKMNSSVLLSASQGQQSRTLNISTATAAISLESCLVMSPAISTIKLTWGANPGDLDSHFFGPTGVNDGEFEVYFANKSQLVADILINLDVDDISSFGPEIITIPNFPVAGRYQYLVNHYSGSGDIALSPARVELKLGVRTSIFTPPDGLASNIWHVFDLIVDENGNAIVEPINAWLDNKSERINVNTNSTTIQGKNKSLFYQSADEKYYTH